MKLDREATEKAPKGWEIWCTTSQWRATHTHVRDGELGLWGPLRQTPDEAISDAKALDERFKDMREAEIRKRLVKCPRHGRTHGIEVSGTSDGQPWSSRWQCLRCWIEVMVGLIEQRYRDEGLLARPERIPEDDSAEAS